MWLGCSVGKGSRRSEIKEMVQNLQVLNIREYPLSPDRAFWKFLVQSAFPWCWWYNLCLSVSLFCNSLAPPAFPAVLSIWSSDSWPLRPLPYLHPYMGPTCFLALEPAFPFPAHPFILPWKWLQRHWLF